MHKTLQTNIFISAAELSLQPESFVILMGHQTQSKFEMHATSVRLSAYYAYRQCGSVCFHPTTKIVRGNFHTLQCVANTNGRQTLLSIAINFPNNTKSKPDINLGMLQAARQSGCTNDQYSYGNGSRYRAASHHMTTVRMA